MTEPSGQTKPPRQLHTARLLLRPPVLDDADAIFTTYAQDEEVCRYVIWRPHRSIDETRAFLTRCVGAWQQGGAYPWIITRQTDGRLLGMIELRVQGTSADLGYVLGRAFWGQGLVSEAVAGVRDWVLAQPGIERLWAICDPENKASARVLEKCGLVRESHTQLANHPNLSDDPRQCPSFAILRPPTGAGSGAGKEGAR